MVRRFPKFIYLRSLPHTRRTSMKRFTNHNFDVIVIDRGFCISYEFEYFYQCIITFWCLRDKIDNIDPKGMFLNLFGDFSPLCCVPQAHQVPRANSRFGLVKFVPSRIRAKLQEQQHSAGTIQIRRRRVFTAYLTPWAPCRLFYISVRQQISMKFDPFVPPNYRRIL